MLFDSTRVPCVGQRVTMSPGQALLHVMEENMRYKAGARSDAPFFLVLLTDGKSQDDAIAAATRLKNAGVEIIAVGEMMFFFLSLRYVLSWLSVLTALCSSGVKNADEAELRQVASEPVDLNVYNVNDFPLLSKLVARLVHILCGRIEERGITKRMLPIFVAICWSVFSSRTDLFLMISAFQI